ncbi:MAG: hypothetical protein ACPL1A_04955 [Candidatus Kapaibacteriota bacterium]
MAKKFTNNQTNNAEEEQKVKSSKKKANPNPEPFENVVSAPIESTKKQTRSTKKQKDVSLAQDEVISTKKK